MDAQRWLEQFERELIRRKLPPLYVERLLSELSDHLFDSLEDPMSTDAKDLRSLVQRVGTPHEVASSAALEHRRAHICRRHPIVSFVLLPLVALPLLWAGSLFVLIALAKAFGLETGGEGVGSAIGHWARVNAPLVSLAMLIVPIGVAAFVFCRIAARSDVTWKWTLAACGILAIVGGMAMVNIVMPGAANKGTVMFGMGLGMRPTEAQLAQFALPLDIAALAIWRQVAHRQRGLAG